MSISSSIITLISIGFSAVFFRQLIATDPKRQRANLKQKKTGSKNAESSPTDAEITEGFIMGNKPNWLIIKTNYLTCLKVLPPRVLWLLVWCPVIALMFIADWSALVMWLGGIFIIGWFLVIKPSTD